MEIIRFGGSINNGNGQWNIIMEFVAWRIKDGYKSQGVKSLEAEDDSRTLAPSVGREGTTRRRAWCSDQYLFEGYDISSILSTV